MRSPSRRGFSLTELFFVLTVCSVALLLVPPAVSRSAQFGREAECKNHLKQLGLAMHNYHDVYDGFPPGWCQKSWDGDEPRALSWQYSLLPYMDHASLFEFLIQKRAGEKGTAEELEKRMLAERKDEVRSFQKMMLCPSVGRPGTKNAARGGHLASSYVVNFGSIPPPRLFGRPELMRGLPGALAETPRQRELWGGPHRGGGAVGCNESLRISAFVDGTSNTLLTAERDPSNSGGLLLFVRGNAYETDTVFACPPGVALPPRGQAGHEAMPSSVHRAGVIMGMADGSVHMVNRNIDVGTVAGGGVLSALASRNGGEVVGEF